MEEDNQYQVMEVVEEVEVVYQCQVVVVVEVVDYQHQEVEVEVLEECTELTSCRSRSV